MDHHQENGSAMSRALAIPEVLEDILLHLPPRDILRAQQISNFFQAVIRGSKLLQENIFLLPQQAAATRCTNGLIFDQTDALLQLDDQVTALSMLVAQPPQPRVTVRAISVEGHQPGVCRITNPAGVTLRDVRCQYSWWSDRTVPPLNVWLDLPVAWHEGSG
ncbi:uncharacterized protein K489DRAFT_59117 [Dissoconium aciculare CBS 342.82]|uniref:F-box domain-containing protein n=1 Tax=Dissoconium aciculare CBS 342.82 TaxID=1314786 RepID=A0A6J3LYV1_9PEZI|nr:uncharacterized protein K489DRAFT_59117 [Dissoconium aciculare CBS 342.82]KAF1819812.1 hypothetical protein K489DRAFT_59117 [Dissoconium aciculare CBS 342.82]